MYSGPLRIVRAFIVSATCVALTLAAHLLGAGRGALMLSGVGVAGLLMTIVLLTLVLAALSGRRWTLGRSMVALALGRVGLHAIFKVLFSSTTSLTADASMTADEAFITFPLGGASMVLAHGVAVLLIGVGIAVNDAALDAYFSVASWHVGPGISVLSPWHLASLITAAVSFAAIRVAGRAAYFAYWQRPRILTELVVLHCLSRRGPPALALVS